MIPTTVGLHCMMQYCMCPLLGTTLSKQLHVSSMLPSTPSSELPEHTTKMVCARAAPRPPRTSVPASSAKNLSSTAVGSALPAMSGRAGSASHSRWDPSRRRRPKRASSVCRAQSPCMLPTGRWLYWARWTCSCRAAPPDLDMCWPTRPRRCTGPCGLAPAGPCLSPDLSMS